MTALAVACNLKTMIFSHPGNADMAFEEYCTPDEKDAFFGASYDGYRILGDQNRECLAFGNPEYHPQAEMDRFFKAAAERAKAKKAFRCVMILPYEEGKPNRSGGSQTGVGIMKGMPGVTVTELAVMKADSFSFWRGSFWYTGERGRGNARWPVALVMVQNEEANSLYPINGEAWRRIGLMLQRQCGVGQVVLAKLGKEIAVEEGDENFRQTVHDAFWRNVRALEQRCEPKEYYKSECDLATANGILDAETMRYWNPANEEEREKARKKKEKGRKKGKRVIRSMVDVFVGANEMINSRPWGVGLTTNEERVRRGGGSRRAGTGGT